MSDKGLLTACTLVKRSTYMDSDQLVGGKGIRERRDFNVFVYCMNNRLIWESGKPVNYNIGLVNRSE